MVFKSIKSFFNKILGRQEQIVNQNGNQSGNFISIEGDDNHVTQNYSVNVHPLMISMSEFVNTFQTDGKSYISFQKFDEIKDNILNGNYSLIQFLGLSGIGKSRMMFEIFKNVDNSNNYYCANASDERLINELSSFLRENQKTEGIIVLDNCDADSFRDVCKLRIEVACLFKIVGVYYNPNDVVRKDGVNQLFLRRGDLVDSVNEYIVNQLEAYGEQAETVKSQIQKLSDGFPVVAINAIESYKENEFTKLLSDDDLWKRMCNYQTLSEDKQKALQSLSLFEPLGYEQEVTSDYEFVKSNKAITPIFNKSQQEIEDIFETLIKAYAQNELIEINTCWLLVRPLPLAVWLVEKWFENCGTKRLLNVIYQLDVIQDKTQADRLKNALCKRMECMQGNEKAKLMYEKLVAVGAPFHHEEVVCSDFGSRLFLAMSSVNPVAVTKCLYDILDSKAIEWTKATIKGEIRRNYIWCLQKLSMPEETFQMSALLLAKFSLAENESWANNATGVFAQLFHVALPGTVASLKQRLAVIQTLDAKGEEYLPVTLKAVDSAYNYSSFHRSGGFEHIEGKELKDYEATGEDILEYWNGCLKVLENILNHSPQRVDEVSRIIEKHVDDIAWRAGCFDLLESLMFLVINIQGFEWPEMHKRLLQYKRYNVEKLSEDRKNRIDEWLEKLGGNNFLSKLDETHAMFYTVERGSTFDDRLNQAIDFFTPIARLFQENKLYDDSQVVETLLDNQTNEVGFIRALSKVLRIEQKEKLMKTIIHCIQSKSLDYQSNFLVVFYFAVNDSALQSNFLKALYKSGKFLQYIVIRANSETEDRVVLEELIDILNHHHLPLDVYLKAYLYRVPVKSAQDLFNLCSYIQKYIPNSDNVLLNYVIAHEYSSVIFETPMKELVQKMLLEYAYPNSKVDVYGVKSLTESILKSGEEIDFAVAWNKKMIQILNDYDSCRAFANIYFTLLPKYQKYILDDILIEMSKRNSEFAYFARRELGSGSGFGAGPLFQCDINHIKQVCMEQSQGMLPQRLAYLSPVFNYSNNDDPAFSEFFYWMLEKFELFKNKKEILSSFSSNMGTFSWAGSVIPLLEKKLKCLEKVKNHSAKMVREWADAHIKSISEQLRIERNSEAYRALI